MNKYYGDLKNLIEMTVRKTGKKAKVLAFSYGNLILNHFLAKKTHEVRVFNSDFGGFETLGPVYQQIMKPL